MDQFKEAMKVASKCQEWLDKAATHKLRMQVLGHLFEHYQSEDEADQQQDEGEKPPF